MLLKILLISVVVYFIFVVLQVHFIADSWQKLFIFVFVEFSLFAFLALRTVSRDDSVMVFNYIRKFFNTKVLTSRS